MTILKDGTTKHGKRIHGIKLASKTEIFTVGLKVVSQNTAENLFQTTGEVLNEITDNDNKKTNDIINSINNPMTDRCAT